MGPGGGTAGRLVEITQGPQMLRIGDHNSVQQRVAGRIGCRAWPTPVVGSLHADRVARSEHGATHIAVAAQRMEQGHTICCRMPNLVNPT